MIDFVAVNHSDMWLNNELCQFCASTRVGVGLFAYVYVALHTWAAHVNYIMFIKPLSVITDREAFMSDLQVDFKPSSSIHRRHELYTSSDKHAGWRVCPLSGRMRNWQGAHSIHVAMYDDQQEFLKPKTSFKFVDEVLMTEHCFVCT